MNKFEEEKARAVDITIEEEEILEKIIEDEIVEEIAEAEVAEVIEEALGLRDSDPNRRRRDADADADAQVFLTQPLHYAPSYPYYFVNNLLPAVKKVEDENIEEERIQEGKVDEVEMMDPPSKYYTPVYAPAF